MATLGIDFGTSNTAAAVAAGGQPYVIPLENGRDVVPTAVFLDASSRKMVFGHAAVAALVNGQEGRFMRALKRVLGTPLMRESRQIMGKRSSLMDVVTAFIVMVKTQAESATGMTFDGVVSGRPVLFHADPARDQAAEDDLRACYHAAGFTRVDFLFEPEAAALAATRDLPPSEGLSLVVDIGGGTSDYTLFQGAKGADVMASHGLRIGGTDFDRAISISHAMPELGMGGHLKAVFGSETSPAPVAVFHDLATWEKIAFLYTPDTRRAAEDMARVAVDPKPFKRLASLLTDETGHDLAFAVEKAKIAANGEAASGKIDMSLVERALTVPLDRAALDAAVGDYARDIASHALETVAKAKADPKDVARVIMVGGSGLIGAVRDHVAAAFPQAQLVQAGAFSAVAEGLGIAAAAKDS